MLLGDHARHHAVDFIGSGMRVSENSLRTRQVLENTQLRIEVLDPVMQHRIVLAFANPRSTAHHEKWHPLGPGIRRGVG